MADFVLPEKRAIIVLDDGDYAGAEITVRLRITLAVVRAIGDALDAKNFDGLRDLFLEEGLLGWNLADHRGPLPRDASGWDRLTPLEQLAIPAAWLQAVVNPDGPLVLRPSATGTSPTSSRSPRRSGGRKSRTASSSDTPATP